MSASIEDVAAQRAENGARPRSERQIILWDVLSTTLATVIIAGANVLTYRLAADQFGPTGFGEYALIRRTLSVVLPAVMVGVGIALPRYLASTSTVDGVSSRDASATDYLGAGWLVVLSAAALVGIVGGISPGYTANLFFGAESYSTLLPVVAGTLGSLCAQSISYSYLRGRLQIRQANIYLIVSNGVFPLAGFLFGRGDVRMVVWWNAILTYGLSAAHMAIILLREGPFFSVNTHALRRLLRYGVPRVPGDFVLAAVISFPSIASAHFASVTTAGVVAFGTTLVTLAGSAMSPLSTVLLPHAVVLARDGKLSMLRDAFRKAFPVFMAAGLIGTVVLELLAPWVVRHFLGESYLTDVSSVRWMLGGVVPYAAFVALRSVNDALYEAPVNAISTYGAAAICALVAGALAISSHRAHAAEAGFVCGMWGLALLTGARAQIAVSRGAA